METICGGDVLGSVDYDFIFSGQLFFIGASSPSMIYKLTPEGFFHSLGKSNTFTVFSEDIVLLRNPSFEPSYNIHFDSSLFPHIQM